jgi:hypothetical protein
MKLPLKMPICHPSYDDIALGSTSPAPHIAAAGMPGGR